MTYLNMLDVIQHVDETRISNLAKTRLVELIPLCLQRLFVSEVKNRLSVIGVCFVELYWANKVSVLIVANMEVFFLLTE